MVKLNVRKKRITCPVANNGHFKMWASFSIPQRLGLLAEVEERLNTGAILPCIHHQRLTF